MFNVPDPLEPLEGNSEEGKQSSYRAEGVSTAFQDIGSP